MRVIPYRKLSKKKRKEVNDSRRVTWADLGQPSPVTKVVPDKRKEREKYKCRKGDCIFPFC